MKNYFNFYCKLFYIYLNKKKLQPRKKQLAKMCGVVCIIYSIQTFIIQTVGHNPEKQKFSKKKKISRIRKFYLMPLNKQIVMSCKRNTSQTNTKPIHE